MRKNRVVEQNRCYHLVSRLAHRAFFFDDEEKDRAVVLMRCVEEFSGVVVLAYAFMSNHFHIFIYVPSAEAVGIKSPIHFSRYYLRPLMENGMIERTDPDSPKSPQTGVQAGMSYYINNTMSMGSAPFAPGPWMVAK